LDFRKCDEDEENLKDIVEAIILNRASDGEGESNLIPILQDIQIACGYLSKEALKIVSNHLNLPLSHIYGVATFYHQFRMRPEGRHIITICKGTACHVTGATDLNNLLLKQLEIEPPEDTSRDGLFTIKQVRCIGACSLSPVIKIDDDVYGKLDTKKLQTILTKYKKEASEDA
jgi:NADH-quinone oxidoreductase subunit E